jgi:RimJ/RimL family protein N-acetyltransferase
MSITLEPMSLAQLEAIVRHGKSAGSLPVFESSGLPPPFAAERSLEQMLGGKSATWCTPFLIISVRDRTIIGSCGFKDVPNRGILEIGYAVSSMFRNQGMATLAVSALLKIAFADKSVTGVLATINPTNEASNRVVQKLGFEKGAMFVDADGEELVRWFFRRRTDVSAQGPGGGA